MRSSEGLMSKNVAIGIAIAIVVLGTGAMVISDSIRFSDFMNALSDLNPRVMTLVLLPFAGIGILVGIYLLRKSEERKWKKALLKTRAAKQLQEEAKRKASEEKQSQ